MFGRSGRKDGDQPGLALPQLHFPVQMPVVGSDKKEFTVSVQRLDSSHGPQEEATLGQPKQIIDETWNPGFRNRFPWIGFIALWTVVLASVGSILVLTLSNHKSEHQWPHWISPNVVLAGLNNAANVAITVAVGEGIAIAWWRKALQGATVKELHHSWAFSNNLSMIIFKYKYFNAVALAAMTTKFAIIDGMLYQKATTTYSGPGNAVTVMIPETGYRQFPVTARLNADGNATGLMTVEFIEDVTQWISASSGMITNGWITVGNCTGDCSTSMLGAGFALDCQTQKKQLDYGKKASTFTEHQKQDNQTLGNSTYHASLNSLTDIPIFSVNFTQQWPTREKNYSWISLDTISYTSVNAQEKDSCPSQMTYRECELRPALINYTIYVDYYAGTGPGQNHDNISSYDLTVVSYSQVTDTDSFEYLYATDVVRNLDVHEEPISFAQTALGGLQQAMQSFLGSEVLMTYLGENGWKIEQTGTLALIEQYADPESDYCSFYFADPLSWIMEQVNTLTFIAMYDTENLDPMTPGPNVTIPQNLTSIQYGTQIYYKSDYHYLFGAVVSTLVCILCILPAYWGFWELGRHVSLGPFEIANALQAPVFEPVQGGAGNVRQVLKAVGRQKLKYGDLVDDGKGGKKLAFT